MDYRKFLARKETLTLPALGGLSVHAPTRRLRLTSRVEPGWWTFDVEGRSATAVTRTEAPELADRPRIRGHLVGPWLFTSGTEAHHLCLMPDEEPERFAIGTGRRWHSDDVLFEGLEFEDEAELAARQTLLDGTFSLEGIKGVSPSLRAAFGFAVLQREAAEHDAVVSLREVLGRVHEVARGTLEPRVLLSEIVARRYQHAPAAAVQPRRSRRRSDPAASPQNVEARAAEVLEAAGADLLAARSRGGREVEVVFRYMGEQFISIVDWETLHVYDAGICLSGADEELGLDALPSVIHEAIHGDLLYITRR